MSISRALADLQSRVSAAFTACQDMGATMPSAKTTANLASCIRTIPAGGGISPDDIAMQQISGKVTLATATVVQSMAFIMQSHITELELLAAKSIHASAFMSCTGLTSVYAPALQSIYGPAFQSCSALRTFISPALNTISYSAFVGCSNLESIDLSTVTSIYGSCFVNCTNLKRVELPKLVTATGTNIFMNCNKLSYVSINPSFSLGLISGMFSTCSSLQEIHAHGVYTIASNVFYRCSSLTVVDLPNLSSTVGSSAFRSCTALSALSLYKTRYVYSTTFSGCTALKSIWLSHSSCWLMPSTTPTSTHFADLPADFKVYVPTAYVDTYKTSVNWSYWSSHIFGY